MKTGKRLFREYPFWAGLLACFVILICLVLLASVPPVSRDALTHHLIIPKLYLGHGSIFEIPYIEFSYYPMNLELLYMIPIGFGNDIIPKYIHLSFEYNGLITFFILSIIIVFIYSRSNSPNFIHQINALKYGSFFVIISLLIFSPWAIKNFIWTGNPIYPLFNSILNFKESSDALKAGAVSVTSFSNGWGPFAVRKIIYGEKWWETLLIPIRIFFQGADNNPKFFDGILNPFLFMLPFFAFNRKKEAISDGIFDKKILLLFSALFILIVFLKQDMRIRWIGPVIPPLILLSVFGLKNIYDFFLLKKRGWKIVIVLIALGAVAINIQYLAGLFKQVKPFEYLSGRVSRIEYIKRYWPEISTINYANKNLEPNCQILALFLGNRRYYSNHKMIFDHDMFKTLIKKSNRIEDIVNDLNKDGFTDIIINYGLFNPWAEKQFSNDEKRVINTFFSQMELLYAQDGFGLYKLKSSQ